MYFVVPALAKKCSHFSASYLGQSNQCKWDRQIISGALEYIIEWIIFVAFVQPWRGVWNWKRQQKGWWTYLPDSSATLDVCRYRPPPTMSHNFSHCIGNCPKHGNTSMPENTHIPNSQAAIGRCVALKLSIKNISININQSSNIINHRSHPRKHMPRPS